MSAPTGCATFRHSLASRSASATVNSTPLRASSTNDREPDLTAAVDALSHTKYGWGEGFVVEIKPT